MKRLILLMILLLFLMGCESKEEDFSKVCIKEIKSNDIVDTTYTKVIYNNKDEVNEVIITRNYKAINNNGNIVIEGIKKSADNYNNNLSKSKAINVKNVLDEDDVYEVEYDLKVKDLSSDELDEFDIRKNSIKYFNKLKKDGIICK